MDGITGLVIWFRLIPMAIQPSAGNESADSVVEPMFGGFGWPDARLATGGGGVTAGSQIAVAAIGGRQLYTAL